MGWLVLHVLVFGHTTYVSFGQHRITFMDLIKYVDQEGKIYVISNNSKTHYKIIVDADSCPVKEIIFRVAEEMAVPVLLIASVAHQMQFSSDNISLMVVDNIPQAADIAVVNKVSPDDIVITGDYGLASIILSKGATALSPRGYKFELGSIDRLLLQRHIDSKIRKGGGRTQGPKAFTNDDRQQFEVILRRVICLQADKIEGDNKKGCTLPEG